LERADAAVLQDGVEVESGKAGVERGDEMEID
jgi:hypothetical protein